MKSTEGLKKIIGLNISKTIQVHDYYQIYFTGGWILNIYNPHSLQGKISKLNELAGLKVVRVADDNNRIRIEFSDGTELQIELREEAYGNNPEGMSLHGPSKEIIVWRYGE